MDYLDRKPRVEAVSYQTADGETVNTNVLMLPAIVKGIPKGENAIRKNSNDTPWRLITVDIKHPKQGVIERNAQLFEKSYEAFPDTFTKGGQIELMVQTEGDGKGLAKAQLQSIERIDVDAWKDLVSEPEEVGETA